MSDSIGMKVYHLKWDPHANCYQIETGTLKGLYRDPSLEIPLVKVDVGGTEKYWDIYDSFPDSASIASFIRTSNEIDSARRALQWLLNSASAYRVKLRDMLCPEYKTMDK